GGNVGIDTGQSTDVTERLGQSASAQILAMRVLVHDTIPSLETSSPNGTNTRYRGGPRTTCAIPRGRYGGDHDPFLRADTNGRSSFLASKRRGYRGRCRFFRVAHEPGAYPKPDRRRVLAGVARRDHRGLMGVGASQSITAGQRRCVGPAGARIAGFASRNRQRL